jgi:hypothetical protein
MLFVLQLAFGVWRESHWPASISPATSMSHRVEDERRLSGRQPGDARIRDRNPSDPATPHAAGEDLNPAGASPTPAPFWPDPSFPA